MDGIWGSGSFYFPFIICHRVFYSFMCILSVLKPEKTFRLWVRDDIQLQFEKLQIQYSSILSFACFP